jgi:hypothetical protein
MHDWHVLCCSTAMCYRLWGIANARSKIRRLQSVLVVCTPVIYVITLVARKARLNMITNCCDSICTVCDAQSGSQSMHEARDVRCTHAAPDGCPMQDCNAPVRAFDVSITWTFQLHARLRTIDVSFSCSFGSIRRFIFMLVWKHTTSHFMLVWKHTTFHFHARLEAYDVSFHDTRMPDIVSSSKSADVVVTSASFSTTCVSH